MRARSGGCALPAPPGEAPAAAAWEAVTAPPARTFSVQASEPVDSKRSVGFLSLVAAALWGAAVMGAFWWRRKARGSGAHFMLS